MSAKEISDTFSIGSLLSEAEITSGCKHSFSSKKSNHICQKVVFENGAIVYGKLSSKDCFQAENAKIKNLMSIDIDVKNITSENVNISDSLTVNGNTTLNTLTANNVEVKNDLNVDGNLSTENLHAQTGTIEILNTQTLVSSTITTDNLTVNQNALIKGDLTVEGTIINVCGNLNEYHPPPPTEEIYDQSRFIASSTIFTSLTPIMEYIEFFEIALAKRLPGVFGYNPNGTLNLTGGNLYTPHVQSMNYKLNSVSAEQVGNIFTIESYQRNLPILTNWFSGRGFPIPPPDTFPSNETQYNFIVLAIAVTINMKFVYGTNPFIPDFIDLVAVLAKIRVSPTYNPNESTRNKTFLYPQRIKLTQSCDEYKSFLAQNIPIIYYEPITQQLEFNFTNQNFLSYDNTVTSLPSNVTTRTQIFMLNFRGRYQLTKRSNNNSLIPSSFNNAECLVQVSDSVFIESSQVINLGVPIVSQRTFRYRTNGIYTGNVIPLINGGNDYYDFYNHVDPGAFSANVSPFITLESTINNVLYPMGDNSNTIPLEYYSSPSSIGINTGQFGPSITPAYFLTVEFLNNPLLPEQADFYPPAVRDFFRESTYTLGHEFTHSIQWGIFGAGLYLIDLEAQAMAVEFDTEINQGMYFSIRTSNIVNYLPLAYAGSFPLLLSEAQALFNGVLPDGTYGEGIWWQWLAKKYDTNYQVLRRTWDVFNARYGPIYTNNDISLLNTYGGGNRLSCQQALRDIYNLELSDIFINYAISLSLLRNNESIPCIYRSVFPFWLQQQAYDDAILTGPLNPFWWEAFDKNSSGTIAPQWFFGTNTFRFEDLSFRLFVFNTLFSTRITLTNIINVENSNPLVPKYGNIYVAMHQYTPGTPTGKFKIQGPFRLGPDESHVFNATDFTDGGLIRLMLQSLILVVPMV
jgi:hypothetical protein